MRILGDDVYIQRGETWTLDFDVTDERGDPYMIFKAMDNPYMAITVTAARYKQKGDFRRTYWLDLDNRFVEQSDGSTTTEKIKRFIGTEALYLPKFDVIDILRFYGTAAGGKIVLKPGDPFDITNYLFFVDEKSDGHRVYKYIKSYNLLNGVAKDVVWEDYNFRIIKQFTTRDWVEQKYLYDIKILAGESIWERIERTLLSEGTETTPLPWTEQTTIANLKKIKNVATREYLTEIYDSGMPLMPDYDTKSLILKPTNIYVSANIQGGN